MRKGTNTAIVVFFTVLFVSFALLPSNILAGKQYDALSMGTCPTAGGWYRLGVGYAKMIKKYAGITTTPEATEGGGFNIANMRRGEMELGWITSAQSYDAPRGIGIYKKAGKQPIRLLWVTYPAPMNLATYTDSPIKTPADIRGKRYMYILKGATTQTQYGNALLEAYGMTKKDCIPQIFSGSTELINAIKEKRTDVWHYPGSMIRHAVWEQITQKVDVRFIGIGKKQAAYIQEHYPMYSFVEFPANVYRNQDYSFYTAAWWSYFVCREDLPDEIAYKVTKAIWEHRDDLLPIDPLYGQFDLKSAVNSFNMPIHPGAIKYFREKGVWGARQEQMQEKNLKAVGASQ